MNPLAFFRSFPTKVIALLAIMLLAGIAVWWYGHSRYEQGVSAERQRQHDAENRALLRRTEENIALQQKYQQDLTKQKKGYSDEIERIKRRHGELSGAGLRVPRTICDGFARTTEAGSGKEGGAAAGTIALPEQVERDLRELMAQADRAVAGCRSDEQFIDENGFREK